MFANEFALDHSGGRVEELIGRGLATAISCSCGLKWIPLFLLSNTSFLTYTYTLKHSLNFVIRGIGVIAMDFWMLS